MLGHTHPRWYNNNALPFSLIRDVYVRGEEGGKCWQRNRRTKDVLCLLPDSAQYLPVGTGNMRAMLLGWTCDLLLNHTGASWMYTLWAMDTTLVEQGAGWCSAHWSEGIQDASQNEKSQCPHRDHPGWQIIENLNWILNHHCPQSPGHPCHPWDSWGFSMAEQGRGFSVLKGVLGVR